MSVLTLPEACTPDGCPSNTNESRRCNLCGSSRTDEAACSCEGHSGSCLGLCIWKAEGSGELLGAARLPRAYGEAVGLYFNRQSLHSSSSIQDEEDFPGVLFCGSDLVVTAGNSSQCSAKKCSPPGYRFVKFTLRSSKGWPLCARFSS